MYPSILFTIFTNIIWFILYFFSFPHIQPAGTGPPENAEEYVPQFVSVRVSHAVALSGSSGNIVSGAAW